MPSDTNRRGPDLRARSAVVQTLGVLRPITGVLVAAALLVAGPTAPIAPALAQADLAQAAPTVARIAGDTRIETAIAISADDFAAGTAGAVVLARSDVFADALSGGPLAAATGAPLLLTTRDELVPATRAEIQRVLPAGRTVYVLGGTAALSDGVQSALSDLGYATRRLQGGNRYDTALAVAREAAPTPEFITVATGNEFPDALIAGSLATAFRGGVMVLTDGDRLPASVDAYLEAFPDAQATTVGPAAAAAYDEVFNVAGPTAADRSVVAAETFYAALGPSGVAVASVARFPDGLAGAAHAFRQGALPLLLTPADDLPDRATAYVEGLDASGRSVVYGGPLAVGEGVVAELRAALER